jgi:hypothetical protein
VSIAPVEDVNVAVLSVASTLMSAMGYGTPGDTESPEEWDLKNTDSQIRLLCDATTDVLIAIEKLTSNYGPSLKTDLFTHAETLLAEIVAKETTGD